MSLAALKAEIEKKRKLAEQASQQPSKYVRNGEVEKARVMEQLEKKRAEKAAKRVDSPPPEVVEAPPEPVNENPEQVPPISKDQLTKRLRERRTPVILFGETDWQRWQRLKKLEENEPVEYIQGMDNEFGKALQDLDDNNDDDLFEKIEEAKEAQTDSTDPGQPQSKEEYILKTLKKYIGEWEQELNDRPDTAKRTAQGKVDTVTYKQCRKHIKPLFKALREKGLPQDILTHVFHICELIAQREYVKANDQYLRMAIGNAAWPMGVTMVGIHERSAREKIFVNQVAHVLNDETQRKYIQAIKRIMTWAQHKYPNLPSKCVG